MNICRNGLAAAAAAWLAVSAGPIAAQPSAEDAAPAGSADAPARHVALAPYVEGAVDALIRDKRLPGMTLSVVSGDRAMLERGFGHADVPSGRAVDPQTTLFRIGSVSKTFIWTAAMMLADRGELDLDADVNDYLDTFEIEPRFGRPVTMRHLMTHRAGFETTLKVFAATDDEDASLAELLAATQPERVRPPGERISYSNWGAALAALVVSNAAGVPFERFVREEILDPLGMDETTQVQPGNLDPARRQQMATGHELRRGEHVAADPMQLGPFAPAGGMAASAGDMGRWMRFHLNRGALDGRRLMSRRAHEEMWSRAFGAEPARPGLAHGFQATRYRGLDLYGHGGSTGNFQSTMVLVPALELGVFVSQNSGQGGYDAVDAVTRLIIDRMVTARGGESASGFAGREPVVAGELADYAGDYRTNRRSFTTMTAAFSLQSTMTVAVDDDELVVTAGGETTRYRPVAGHPDLFSSDRGERIAFLRDASGAVVSVTDGSGVHSHERIAGPRHGMLFFGSVTLGALLSITTLLGFWRRWRHAPETTRAGRQAAFAAFVAAVVVLLFLGIAVFAVAALASLTAADFPSYPPVPVIALSFAAFAVAPAAVLALAALVPAWRGSGWSLVRRLHLTLFALSLALMAWQLWQWRLFGAPYL